VKTAAVAFPPLTPFFILTVLEVTRPRVWQCGQMIALDGGQHLGWAQPQRAPVLE